MDFQELCPYDIYIKKLYTIQKQGEINVSYYMTARDLSSVFSFYVI